MTKISKGLRWISDVIHVLVLYRFDSERRKIAEQASTACRSLKFHAHAKIQPAPLRDLVADLGGQSVEQVVLPGPSTDLGDVGSQAGYHVIGSVVQTLQPKLILEIGTYLGVSAYAMALNAPPDCRIYTVDLPDAASASSVPELNRIDQTHIAKSRHRVGEAFLRSPLQKQIVQIREDSMTFRAERFMSNVDLIYVDGGHSRPIISKDTENAFRVLAANGTIIWDDYFHLYPDVVSFLNELSQQYPLRRISGTNYVMYSRRWDQNAGPRPTMNP